jgi:hypothetical protein
MAPALIVFESILGNTERVARAVADGLARSHPVTVTEAGRAPDQIPPDVDLLVVGGPTHAFGLSRPETRRDAAVLATDPVPTAGRGLREWLDGLAAPGTEVPFAAFDTRVVTPHLPGSAAKKARKRLRAKGFTSIVDPESFHVHGKTGPLVDGEEDRARAWGEALGEQLSHTGTTPTARRPR